MEKNRAIAALIFIATVAAIVLISSVGVGTADYCPCCPTRLAPCASLASTPFSYTSVEKTRAAREQFRSQVPPVYKLDFSPLQQFEKNLRELVAQLEKLEHDYPNPAQRDARQKNPGENRGRLQRRRPLPHQRG